MACGLLLDGIEAVESAVVLLVVVLELGLDLGLVGGGSKVPDAGVEPDGLDEILRRPGLAVGLGQLQGVLRPWDLLWSSRIEHQLGGVLVLMAPLQSFLAMASSSGDAPSGRSGKAASVSFFQSSSEVRRRAW